MTSNDGRARYRVTCHNVVASGAWVWFLAVLGAGILSFERREL